MCCRAPLTCDVVHCRRPLLLPSGYGFSSAPKGRGCGVTAIAGIMDSLMASLGYSRYIAQVR